MSGSHLVGRHLRSLNQFLKDSTAGSIQSVRPEMAPYFKALQAYWNGEKSQALDLAASEVVVTENTTLRFALYRLWIQVSADLGESLSLSSIRDHLLMVAQSDPENRDSYMALRGIIHVELDQMDAARLLARGLEGFNDNPYVLEFLDCVDAQASSKKRPTDSPSRLLDCHNTIEDWFHWQTVLRSCLRVTGDEQGESTRWIQAQAVAQAIAQKFSGSPTQLEVEMHWSFEQGRFADASNAAAKLVRSFPRNSDYLFFKAYGRFKCGEPKVCLDILRTEVAGLAGQEVKDADFVLLRAMCQAEAARRSGTDDLTEVNRSLRAAVALAKREGLPTLHLTTMLAEVEEKMRNDRDEPDHSQSFRPARIWFVKVSPQQFHELRSATEGRIRELVRPMGDQPQNGDLVFFAGEGPSYNPSGRPGWRIAAVYSVASPPAWHPIQRYQSTLQLLSRPEFAIPIDMQVLDESKGITPDVARNHPIRFGVYEVEAGALDVITEVVRSRSEVSAASIEKYFETRATG